MSGVRGLKTRTFRCAYCSEPVETEAMFPPDARIAHDECWREANPPPPPLPVYERATYQREPVPEDMR